MRLSVTGTFGLRRWRKWHPEDVSGFWFIIHWWGFTSSKVKGEFFSRKVVAADSFHSCTSPTNDSSLSKGSKYTWMACPRSTMSDRLSTTGVWPPAWNTTCYFSNANPSNLNQTSPNFEKARIYPKVTWGNCSSWPRVSKPEGPRLPEAILWLFWWCPSGADSWGDKQGCWTPSQQQHSESLWSVVVWWRVKYNWFN